MIDILQDTQVLDLLVEDDVTIVEAVEDVTEIFSDVLRGPPGDPGTDGASIPPIAFSFGDATPDAIFTAPDSGTFTLTRLVVETAFDGAGATVALGVTGNLSALLSASEIYAGEPGEFESTPDVHVTAGTQAFISITPGSGASQGAGRVFLQFVPD